MMVEPFTKIQNVEGWVPSPILSLSSLCLVGLISVDVSTGLHHPVISGWVWPWGSTNRDQRVGRGSRGGCLFLGSLHFRPQADTSCKPFPAALWVPGTTSCVFSLAELWLPDIAHARVHHLSLLIFYYCARLLKMASLLSCPQLPFLNELSVSRSFSDLCKEYDKLVSYGCCNKLPLIQ